MPYTHTPTTNLPYRFTDDATLYLILFQHALSFHPTRIYRVYVGPTYPTNEPTILTENFLARLIKIIITDGW